MLAFVLFGFLIGLQHALEADHVAAVGAIASQRRGVRQIARIGAAWGLGHTVTLALFGGLLLAFDLHLDSTLAGALEFAVGLMLVWLGGRIALRLIVDRVHFHVHRHLDVGPGGDRRPAAVHLHAHSHAARGEPDTRSMIATHGALTHHERPHEHHHPVFDLRRTFLVGIMHGLAGSAAIVAMSASGTGRPVLALGFIVLFGLGSILGMSLLSMVIAVPLSLAAASLTWANRLLQAAAAGFALLIGANLLVTNGPSLLQILARI